MEQNSLFTLHDVGLVRDGKVILQNVNFTVTSGDFVAVTGPNGGGKTTMLRIILGLLKPSSGKVEFASPRPTIGYLPQKNTVDSHFPLTVAQVVESGLLGTQGLEKEEIDRRTRDILRQIEMEEYARQPIGKLSGGQLQRTLLGRAIIARPALLILDEPLSYLDKHFETHIYSLLEELAQKCTVLLVSHDMNRIDAMANRHITVDHTVYAE